MSRSTFSGSGAYAAHGLGKEARTWKDMELGIAGVMNFNMFGIPMTGPNACGYYGATIEDELCARWIQLSSMLPLARTNRAAGAAGGPPMEPYNLKSPYDVIAKNALIGRLQFIRQIYTCLFEASQDGGTCVDPLLFHFPDDDMTFAPTMTENSFILANALKVVPVVAAVPAGTKAPTVRTYFPKGDWVNMANTADIRGNLLKGAWVELPVPSNSEDILTYLKPGSMVAFQKNNGGWTTTTDVLNSAPLRLTANIDPNGWASGTLFLDKGESLSELENKDYEYYKFHLSAGSLKKSNLNNKALYSVKGLDELVIVNAEALKDTDFACWITNDEVVTELKIEYSKSLKTLTISDKTPIDLTILRDLYYGNSARDQNLCYGVGGHDKQFYM